MRSTQHVFPVPTGMNRRVGFVLLVCVCVPRAHGDEPWAGANCSLIVRCSPCPRG